MTNQEAFNKVWQRFVVEKSPRARKEEGGCVYGDVSGLQCGVGCLLPLEYAIALEDYLKSLNLVGGTGINNIFELDNPNTQAIVLAFLTPVLEMNRLFLSDLQYAHDSQFHRFAEELRDISTLYALTIPGDN